MMLRSDLDEVQNQNNDLTTYIETQEASTPAFRVFSFRETFIAFSQATIPFALSRLAISVQSMFYAYMTSCMGHTAIASSPLISAWQNVLVSPIRGGIAQSMNVLISRETDPLTIGRIYRQAHLFALGLSIPTTALLLNTSACLALMGTDPVVAEQVQHYFNGYSIGVFPVYTLVISQQLTLGIKKRLLATLIGVCYASSLILSGYLFAFQTPGFLHENTYALGLGFSVSAWFMDLALKLYFLISPDFRPYALLTMTDFFKSFKEHMGLLLKLSTPVALQALSESVNLMVISALMSRMSNDALLAEQASVQWMNAFTPLILAVSTVSGSMMSRLYGQYQRFVASGQYQTGRQVLTQMGRQIGASVLFALGLGSVFGALFLGIPRSLASIFIGDEIYAPVATMAVAMLHTNAWSIWIEPLRLTLIGNLYGMDDAVRPAVVSFLLISVLGLIIGGVFTGVFGANADWLFIIRSAAIIATTLVIAWRANYYLEGLQADIPHGTRLLSLQPLGAINSTSSEDEPLLPVVDVPQTHASGYGSFFSAPATRLSTAWQRCRAYLWNGS